MWLCFSKQNAIYYHFCVGYKISPVGKKNTLFCEYISRLSSFTVYHSVILFCSSSIKLIVFLGNYPQPPAGQISIHDLNNAYQKEFNGIYLIRIIAFSWLFFFTQSPMPGNSEYLSSLYLIPDKVALIFKICKIN